MPANFTNGDVSGRAFSCNCVGPQLGMPRCPCAMRGLIQRDGRWIQPEVDLGPVSFGIEPTLESVLFDLAKRQEPLGAEFEQALETGREGLYEP